MLHPRSILIAQILQRFHASQSIAPADFAS
jgi:hypothetical protein